MIRTISSRDFTRDVKAAKTAAEEGPVFVTTRGEPAFVLLSIQSYRELAGGARPLSLLDAMDAVPCDLGDVEFEPPRLDGAIRGVDLD